MFMEELQEMREQKGVCSCVGWGLGGEGGSGWRGGNEIDQREGKEWIGLIEARVERGENGGGGRWEGEGGGGVKKPMLHV